MDCSSLKINFNIDAQLSHQASHFLKTTETACRDNILKVSLNAIPCSLTLGSTAFALHFVVLSVVRQPSNLAPMVWSGSPNENFDPEMVGFSCHLFFCTNVVGNAHNPF